MNLKKLKLIIESELKKIKENKQLLLERQYYNSLMAAKYGCNNDCPGLACSQALMINGPNANQYYNICGGAIVQGGDIMTPNKEPMNVVRPTGTSMLNKKMRKR